MKLTIFFNCCRLCLFFAGINICCSNIAAQTVNNDITPVYRVFSFSYNQVPDKLVSEYTTPAGYSFQWEHSITPVDGYTDIPGATSHEFIFTAPLNQTTYFRRKAISGGTTVTSNLVKLELVSINWENYNYIREHDIIVPGSSDWKDIDQLPIGSKLQTTTYLDGLGRPLQKISREAATPPEGSAPNSVWGDIVQFSQYDAFGRQPKQYLPYTTTALPGKLKNNVLTEQSQYYATAYNETAAYTLAAFDNSPLNRVLNIKSPGTSWAAGIGNATAFELNKSTDQVRFFTIAYTSGAVPVTILTYTENTLFKTRATDENGNQVITFTNSNGQIILTKTQIDANPGEAHTGWICVYSIYDCFGLLRYRLQPEAVKWLDANSWSFSGSNGQQVLDDLCFRYEYDEQGRNILKKAPGAKELLMLYDNRDRVVFMQDGNQRQQSPPEWTTNLYDELDRPVLTTLFRTSKTAAALQADIANAPEVTFVTINAQGLQVGTYKNPLTETELNDANANIIIKYNFYDKYNYAGVKTFTTFFDNELAYPTAFPDGGELIEKTNRTINMPTGTVTRVLGSNTFLTSTVYYDEKGRVIQNTDDNIKNGTDVTTMQYQFDGRVLSTNTKHTTPGTGYTSYSVVTKNLFDKTGRIIGIEKKYGTNDFKAIGNYSMDDMGRLSKKKLSPAYPSATGGLETLAYSYNIHNEITGINKDYALKTGGLYNKWENFFGLYLGYDNTDGIFAAAQLDGHVTGAIWNTQGDDAQRKYDFTYDRAGRLTNALFYEKQQPANAWSNTSMDFTVSGSSGAITYDLNGNLLNMLQKGILPGNATPVNIDNLTYTYAGLSNKLVQVADNGTAGAANGHFGDFKDGANATGNDYVYDDNGNLIIDLNKGVGNALVPPGAAGAIRYNFLDKPEDIRIAGKGRIKIVYDADGNKLQKLYTPEGGGTTTTTTYINEYVYKENELQYINFEEGRLRVMQPVSVNNGYDQLTLDGNISLPGNTPAGGKGTFDFFIRDYQGNVRMILTEQTHAGSNACTMETSRAANEEPLFGEVDAAGTPTAANEVKARYPAAGIPGQATGHGWDYDGIGEYVIRIGNLAGKKTGPNTLLKVMGGDLVSGTAMYYYKNPVTNSSNGNTLLTSILTALAQAISGSTAAGPLIKGAAGNITNAFAGNLPFINTTSPDAANPNGTNPKAYLTVLFFDERFNFVAEGSTALRVQTPGTGAAPLVFTNIKAPKNGYAYIYVSNESDEHVYFDNLQVSHVRGRIIEENHYYAYGLKIAAISSRKLPDPAEGGIKNNNLYNDKELWGEADLNWYDYGFRSYDPQIGRFPQLDPLTFEYPELTNYQYAGCEPIANVDLDGLEPLKVTKVIPGKLKITITGGTVAIAEKEVLRVVAKNTGRVVTMQIAKSPSVLSKIASGLLFVGARALGVIGGVLTTTPAGEGSYKPMVFERLQPLPAAEPEPVNNPKKDDRIHEQYVLVANQDEQLGQNDEFDIMERGQKNPVGIVNLKKGEVWKYGTTVNPEKRYVKKWLVEKKLLKLRQASGTKEEVRILEKVKIKKYKLQHGVYPPGNKQSN